MKKETFIGILILGTMACGYVFGDVLGGGFKSGVSGLMLSVVSMFIGMLVWGMHSHDMSNRAIVQFRKSAAKEREAIALQRKEDWKNMLSFSETLSRNCMARIISMTTEGSRSGLMEKSEAVIAEEIGKARDNLGIPQTEGV